MKIFISVLFVLICVAEAWCQPLEQEDGIKQDILFQLQLYEEISQYMADLFQKFSEGYIEANEALEKANLLKHEYKKRAVPVSSPAENLYQLVMDFLSQVENYFIYFKRANRENPEINLKIARVKFNLAKEADRLYFEFL